MKEIIKKRLMEGKILKIEKMEKRIEKALTIILNFEYVYEYKHNKWVIDQVVRALTGCPDIGKEVISEDPKKRKYMKKGKNNEYRRFIIDNMYHCEWDKGVSPQ